MNKPKTLQIEGGIIRLWGFGDLKPKVTFCFLPAGVVIMNDDKVDEKSFRIQAEVDANCLIYNEQIVEQLIKRGITSYDEFFLHENCFYEMDPHRVILKS